MTKYCNCRGIRNKFMKTDVNTESNESVLRTNLSEHSYVGGKQISEFWEEINFAANPSIANNNFTKSLLWGN